MVDMTIEKPVCQNSEFLHTGLIFSSDSLWILDNLLVLLPQDAAVLHFLRGDYYFLGLACAFFLVDIFQADIEVFNAFDGGGTGCL